MKNEMSAMKEQYDESADMMQEDMDSMLPTISGRFGKAALNGLVKSFNAALEAAGVKLVYPSEAPAQLIDNDERTTVTIFTPYAPPGG